mgnify:CR=1 FL=1
MWVPAPPRHAVAESHIIARVHPSVLDLPAEPWNALLAQQTHATPFMRHEYLAALESSGSATPRTGWTPRFISLWDNDVLMAACPLYLKDHSYGEYVFDWAWANAYEQHGVPYYPKAVVAVPLFKRIGLGSVLGYLAAGLAIGPFGLALVSDPQSILHLAELGVVCSCSSSGWR